MPYSKYESALKVVQRSSVLIGLPPPAFVVGNDDAGVMLALGLVEQAGRSLLNAKWQSLVRTYQVAYTPNSDGLVVLPEDFNGFLSDTQYNRADQQVVQPVQPGLWQRSKVQTTSGVGYMDFRRYQDNVYLSPAPATTFNFSFEYWSRAWVRTAAGSYQDYVAADDDTLLFDSLLLELAVKVLFLEAKGFATQAALARYAQLYDGLMNMEKDGAVLNTTATVNARNDTYRV